MATGRVLKIVPWLVFVGLTSTGCSQSNPFTQRQTMVGSLKASVSQLEFENEKLKKNVGELKADNSRLDSLLAQEQDARNEVAARLDDAKEMIRRQGGNLSALGASSRNFEDDEIPPPAATPRSRTMKGGRKPPTAQIPQPYDADPSPAPFGSSNDGLGYQPPTRSSRDLGENDGNSQWLPVARGTGSQVR